MTTRDPSYLYTLGDLDNPVAVQVPIEQYDRDRELVEVATRLWNASYGSVSYNGYMLSRRADSALQELGEVLGLIEGQP